VEEFGIKKRLREEALKSNPFKISVFEKSWGWKIQLPEGFLKKIQEVFQDWNHMAEECGKKDGLMHQRQAASTEVTPQTSMKDRRYGHLHAKNKYC
jgi:hypothetical protein